ncbi:MAG: hypothetical protein HY925_01385 [Elusimicrobia bacterium]|nr:hypothetical protein [Elusimicrobiota bacterium]
MSAEPEHVASGGFRIDRRKALEKLAEYQLPDPKRFLLPWLRCAQACGAGTADLKFTASSITLTFDGKPLASRYVREPFDALFADEADSARHRDLATGLLTAFRLSPAEASVVSGVGDERLRLRGKSAEDAQAEVLVDGGTITSLTVSWKGNAKRVPAECVEAAASAARMLPFTLFVNGAAAAAEPRDPYVRTEIDGTRVRVSIPLDPTARDTTVRVHKRGVFTGEVPIQTPIDVTAEIDRDDFVLDASQSMAVRDDRLENALKLVPGAIDGLIVKACGVQREYPRLAAFLFAPDKENLRARMGATGWAAKVLAVTTDWTGMDGGGSLKACMEFEAHVTRWLRIVAARSLFSYAGDSGQPAARALWETPLFLGINGKGLSLAALKEQCTKRGLVPVARTVRPGPPDLDIVWLPAGPDGTLEALFPGKIREMDELLESLLRS